MRLFERTILMLVLSLVLCTQALAHQSPEPFRLVVVHSYDPSYVWTQLIDRGIVESLRGFNVQVTRLYLDAKRRPSRQSIADEAAAALAEIERIAPQAVIAADDAAQEFLAAPHLKGRTTPQVIFCGVNAPLKTYGFPASNVSGVRERWHFREGFALLKKINPKIKTVAVLVEDTKTGRLLLEDLRSDERQNGHFALRVTEARGIRTLQEWKRAVLAAQKNNDALALDHYHSLIDENTGQVAPEAQVVAWNNANVRKPSLGFTDSARPNGNLCGVLESGQEQGQLAGQMAREVLERGVSSGSLPVRVNTKGVILVNLKTAERLGITIPYAIISAASVVVK
jgi:ABC-type uncharacterized transport system substrate-binding protein